METLLQNIIDSWLLIVTIIVIVIVAAIGYSWLAARMERRVKKAWLDLYELFLARADRIPLLIESARQGITQEGADPHAYDGIFDELIIARAATSAMPHPSRQKYEAEKELEKVLARTIETLSTHEGVKKQVLFHGILRELAPWSNELEMHILGYNRTLRTYRSFALGSLPEGYETFEY